MSTIQQEGILALLEEISDKLNKLSSQVDLSASSPNEQLTKDDIKAILDKMYDIFRINATKFNDVVISRQSDFLKEVKDAFNIVSNLSKEVESLNTTKKDFNLILHRFTEFENSKRGEQRVKYTFDIKNSKLFLFVGFLLISIGFLAFSNYHILIKNNELKDTDLKYKYIKILHLNSSDSTDVIYNIERAFSHPKDNRMIKEIKDFVKEYDKQKALLQNNKND